VSSIDASAFAGCASLASVSIPPCITQMSITFPDTYTKIKKVTFVGNWTTIYNYSFVGCTALTGVDIPSSVTSIGVNAFYGCSGLTNVDIPSSVTSIGNNAFKFCTDLTDVTILRYVTSIGANVFEGCAANLTIHTTQGSAAEIYAIQNNIAVDANYIDAQHCRHLRRRHFSTNSDSISFRCFQ
jgi:hypothetical protein